MICKCGHEQKEHSWWDWNGQYEEVCGDHCKEFQPDNLKYLLDKYERKVPNGRE